MALRREILPFFLSKKIYRHPIASGTRFLTLQSIARKKGERERETATFRKSNKQDLGQIWENAVYILMRNVSLKVNY